MKRWRSTLVWLIRVRCRIAFGIALVVGAFAGPAYYFGGASGLGGQLHVDAAAGFTHLQFVAAARGSWVDRFTGETLRAHSLELGLRVQ